MTRIISAIFLTVILAGFTTAQDKAPDFNIPELGGENFQLSDHIGEGPLLINFWATWCIPCHAEMKALKKVYKRYKDQGLKIVSISIDDTRTVSKVKGFVRSKRYPFTILLDTNKEVFQLFQGTSPPLSILIDKDGRMVYTHLGYRKGDEKKVEEWIIKLLGAEMPGQ